MTAATLSHRIEASIEQHDTCITTRDASRVEEGFTMQLSDAEKRILLAALREFSASADGDFRTMREYHSFLREEDEEVSVQALAQKLGVEPIEK